MAAAAAPVSPGPPLREVPRAQVDPRILGSVKYENLLAQGRALAAYVAAMPSDNMPYERCTQPAPQQQAERKNLLLVPSDIPAGFVGVRTTEPLAANAVATEYPGYIMTQAEYDAMVDTGLCVFTAFSADCLLELPFDEARKAEREGTGKKASKEVHDRRTYVVVGRPEAFGPNLMMPTATADANVAFDTDGSRVRLPAGPSGGKIVVFDDFVTLRVKPNRPVAKHAELLVSYGGTEEKDQAFLDDTDVPSCACCFKPLWRVARALKQVCAEAACEREAHVACARPGWRCARHASFHPGQPCTVCFDTERPDLMFDCRVCGVRGRAHEECIDASNDGMRYKLGLTWHCDEHDAAAQRLAHDLMYTVEARSGGDSTFWIRYTPPAAATDAETLFGFLVAADALLLARAPWVLTSMASSGQDRIYVVVRRDRAAQHRMALRTSERTFALERRPAAAAAPRAPKRTRQESVTDEARQAVRPRVASAAAAAAAAAPAGWDEARYGPEHDPELTRIFLTLRAVDLRERRRTTTNELILRLVRDRPFTEQELGWLRERTPLELSMRGQSLAFLGASPLTEEGHVLLRWRVNVTPDMTTKALTYRTRHPYDEDVPATVDEARALADRARAPSGSGAAQTVNRGR